MTSERSPYGVFLLWLNFAVLFFFLYVVAISIFNYFFEHRQSSEATPAKQTVCPPPEFETAMQKARDPDLSDVSKKLVALTQKTPDLQWYPNPDDPNAKVLVAVWSSYSGYQKHSDQNQACRMTKNVWVTPVPQLQRACREFGLKGTALDERLGKYLGLRPEPHDGFFVTELWVKPKDVFRPCPDREVEDTQCRVGLPDIPQDAADCESHEADIRHAHWFADEFMKKYFDNNPYPWTRLGYTYDWGNSANHVGASEFVIRENATVWIASTTATEAYCTDDRPQTSTPKDETTLDLGGC